MTQRRLSQSNANPYQYNSEPDPFIQSITTDIQQAAQSTAQVRFLQPCGAT